MASIGDFVSMNACVFYLTKLKFCGRPQWGVGVNANVDKGRGVKFCWNCVDLINGCPLTSSSELMKQKHRLNAATAADLVTSKPCTIEFSLLCVKWGAIVYEITIYWLQRCYSPDGRMNFLEKPPDCREYEPKLLSTYTNNHGSRC